MSKDFTELFDEWSTTYDDTVHGSDIEYKEVFAKYDYILETIARHAQGTVLEFGVGTGNLTRKLIDEGLQVIGVEPSEKMREIATTKLPGLTIKNGDFLLFPAEEKIDSIVSSYAFHHLTDSEKEEAIAIYADLLQPGGKIVFGDTFFKDAMAKEAAYQKAKNQGYERLAFNLMDEYYTTIPIMTDILERHHFTAHFEQLNDFVWLMEAIKK